MTADCNSDKHALFYFSYCRNRGIESMGGNIPIVEKS